MPRIIEVENINRRPFIKILDDHKYIAEMRLVNGDEIVKIGRPVTEDYSGTIYPIFVNGEEIFGTGADSFGQAIVWGESYLTRNTNSVEDVIRRLRTIEHESKFLSIVFERATEISK